MEYSRMWGRWAVVWDSMLSLVGFDDAYRERAVEKLLLQRGDSVVDLACGTGLNFRFIEEKVGEEGRIIALDYSKVMLEKARRKIVANGWHNIRLVEADASDFALGEQVDAVLCTWAMVSISDYEAAISCAADVLKGGGSYSMLDFQLSRGVRGWLLNPVYRLLFWATHQDVSREPLKTMEKYLTSVCKEDIYSRLVSCYIAWGTRPEDKKVDN